MHLGLWGLISISKASYNGDSLLNLIVDAGPALLGKGRNLRGIVLQ